jgi:hypothetical protein
MPSDDDGRTGMDTRFYPEEALNTAKYERLKQCHETRESKQAAIDADRRRDGATWCNSLSMTDYQRDRVLYLIDRVSFDDPLNGYALGAIEGILAIIVHVAAEDGRELIEVVAVGKEGTHVQPANGRFETILDHLSVDADAVATTRRLLREEIESVE